MTAKSSAKDSYAPLFYGLVGISTVLFVWTLQVISRCPIEKRMGIVQKIFYFHVPVRLLDVPRRDGLLHRLGALSLAPDRRARRPRASGGGGGGALRRDGADDGPLWAAKAWGVYWTWDPRLTTSLLSVLIYVAYLVLRAFGGDGEGERKFAAALGVLGGFNLPIIHFSVQKWSGQHPTVITAKGGGLQHPDMKLALGLSFAAFTVFAVTLLWTRVRLELAKSRLDARGRRRSRPRARRPDGSMIFLASSTMQAEATSAAPATAPAPPPHRTRRPTTARRRFSRPREEPSSAAVRR